MTLCKLPKHVNVWDSSSQWKSGPAIIFLINSWSYLNASLHMTIIGHSRNFGDIFHRIVAHQTFFKILMQKLKHGLKNNYFTNSQKPISATLKLNTAQYFWSNDEVEIMEIFFSSVKQLLCSSKISH